MSPERLSSSTAVFICSVRKTKQKRTQTHLQPGVRQVSEERTSPDLPAGTERVVSPFSFLSVWELRNTVAALLFLSSVCVLVASGMQRSREWEADLKNKAAAHTDELLHTETVRLTDCSSVIRFYIYTLSSLRLFTSLCSYIFKQQLYLDKMKSECEGLRLVCCWTETDLF